MDDHAFSRDSSHAMEYPFFRTVFNRRSRRICKGIRAVNAGSHSYRSQEKPQPLSPLEEAMLIAVTGVTGINLPDRPFEDAQKQPILGTPNMSFTGQGRRQHRQLPGDLVLHDQRYGNLLPAQAHGPRR